MVNPENPHTDPGSPQKPPGEFDKLNRLADHTKGLFEDITSWAELKLQYLLMEYEEQIFQKLKNRVISEVGSVVILGIGVFFGIVTLALGLGAWLGHSAWGFLIVTALLMMTAWAVRYFGAKASEGEEESTLTYTAPETTKKLSGPQLPEESVNNHGKSSQ